MSVCADVSPVYLSHPSASLLALTLYLYLLAVLRPACTSLLPALFLAYTVSLLAPPTCLCCLLTSLIIPLASSPLFLLPLSALSPASAVALLPLFSNFLALLSCLLHLLSCFAPSLASSIIFPPACFSSPCLNNLFTPSFVSVTFLFAYVSSCFRFLLICLAILLMLVHLYKTLLF